MTINELNLLITDDIEESLLSMIELMLEYYTTPINVNVTDRKFLRSIINNYNHVKHFADLNNIRMQEVKIIEDKEMMYDNLIFYLREAETNLTFKYLELSSALSIENAKLHFGSIHYYEFSSDDINEIQNAINVLRELIINEESIDESHKSRLLKRLNKLQSELNKKMTNIDTFLTLPNYIGLAIGKFANDVEPAIEVYERFSKATADILKPIARIFRTTEGLPPSADIFQLPESTDD